MKKLLLIVLIAIAMLTLTFVQQALSFEPPQVEWSKTYGGLGIEYAGDDFVQTCDGGYAMVGCTNFGSGNADFWLVKTDRDGEVQWNKTYGGSGDDIALSIVQTREGGFALAGYTNSFGAGDYQWWLIKTDATGNIQWDICGGTTYGDFAEDLVQTADGGYAVTGYTQLAYEEYDAWLVKTDANGIVQFRQTYGGGSSNSIVQTSDGGYAFTGATFAYASGTRDDVWLVRTDANGDMLWNRTFGEPDKDDTGHDLIQTVDGGCAITGERDWFGATDMWLIKTGVDGYEIWKKSYGGAGVEVGRSIVQTSDRGYAVAGQRSVAHGSPNDVWLVRTDSDGKVLWDFTYGGEQEDWAKCVVLTKDAGYALFGSTNSFGAGTYDFYLIRLASFVTWEHVFKDPCRGTVLKVSTDDHYFQFVAPEKEFPIKQDLGMHVKKCPFFTSITICYEDCDVKLSCYALDERFDFCVACLRDMNAAKTYLLTDPPGTE